MRRAKAKRDANHGPIARHFEALGCSVVELPHAGVAGFPDLVIGVIGENVLVEVKNPETRYGRAGLNANQQAFNRDWRGSPMVAVSTEDEATALVQNMRRRVNEHQAKARSTGRIPVRGVDPDCTRGASTEARPADQSAGSDPGCAGPSDSQA
jgi:Holliday junction resolvase